MKTLLTEYTLLLFILLALFSISIALEFNLYPYISALLPFLWYLSKQPHSLVSFTLFTLSLMITINMSYLLFVDYMNKPWFAGEDPFTCDGPCYGWYTFQRDIGAEIILNFGLIIGFSIIATLIYNIMQNFNRSRD
ncbi:MAG: hypothetical protein K0U38_02960 [Epsilonproteobacteria bacterium]|nr:hypothetical protein [Campylobacterota bacterium]